MRVVAGPIGLCSTVEVVEWLRPRAARVVALDSPRSPAPDGALSRPGERLLARAVCGIRYTPERARLAGNGYYEWVRHGLELYEALASAGFALVECFPTASWTRWAGPRGKARRAAWSRAALGALGLEGVPARLGQDGRDAIAAALTALCYEAGLTEAFGEIAVPRAEREPVEAALRRLR